MLCKYGKQARDFSGVFTFSFVQFFIFWGIFNKTVIPFALIGYLPSHIQRALME